MSCLSLDVFVRYLGNIAGMTQDGDIQASVGSEINTQVRNTKIWGTWSTGYRLGV